MNEQWILGRAANPGQIIPVGGARVRDAVPRLESLLREWALGFAGWRPEGGSGELSLGSRGIHPDEAASFLRAVDSQAIEVDGAGFVRFPGFRQPAKGEKKYASFSRAGEGATLNTEPLIHFGAAAELVVNYGFPSHEADIEVGAFDAVVERDGRTVLAMEAKARVEGPDGLAGLLRSFLRFAEGPPPEMSNHGNKYLDLLERCRTGPVTLWLVAAGARWAFLAERHGDQIVLHEGTVGHRAETHPGTQHPIQD